MMKNIFQDLKRKDHKRYLGGLDVFKYIGPGLLVTVGLLIRATGHQILPQVPSSAIHFFGWSPYPLSC